MQILIIKTILSFEIIIFFKVKVKVVTLNIDTIAYKDYM